MDKASAAWAARSSSVSSSPAIFDSTVATRSPAVAVSSKSPSMLFNSRLTVSENFLTPVIPCEESTPIL